ncbi:MAG: hypothetical protein ACE5J3_12175 [Methanosarcinales archaeon]
MVPVFSLTCESFFKFPDSVCIKDYCSVTGPYRINPDDVGSYKLYCTTDKPLYGTLYVYAKGYDNIKYAIVVMDNRIRIFYNAILFFLIILFIILLTLLWKRKKKKKKTQT